MSDIINSTFEESITVIAKLLMENVNGKAKITLPKWQNEDPNPGVKKF